MNDTEEVVFKTFILCRESSKSHAEIFFCHRHHQKKKEDLLRIGLRGGQIALGNSYDCSFYVVVIVKGVEPEGRTEPTFRSSVRFQREYSRRTESFTV